MKFEPTAIEGAFLIYPEELHDERGFFARSVDVEEFKELGLVAPYVQNNISFNHKKYTLRGMHWQTAPHGDAKLIRCTSGAIFDALVDIRPDSSTYLKVVFAELSAQNHLSLYAPPSVAHGFITLEDNTEVFYQMGAPFVPDAAGGARWNDPSFDIPWPQTPEVINERDANYPDFQA